MEVTRSMLGRSVNCLELSSDFCCGCLTNPHVSVIIERKNRVDAAFKAEALLESKMCGEITRGLAVALHTIRCSDFKRRKMFPMSIRDVEIHKNALRDSNRSLGLKHHMETRKNEIEDLKVFSAHRRSLTMNFFFGNCVLVTFFDS